MLLLEEDACPLDLAILLLGHVSLENICQELADIWVRMFIMLLFIISNNRNNLHSQLAGPGRGNWVIFCNVMLKRHEK